MQALPSDGSPGAVVPDVAAVAHDHEGAAVPVAAADAVPLTPRRKHLTPPLRGRAGRATPFALLPPRHHLRLAHSNAFAVEPAVARIAGEPELGVVFRPVLATAALPALLAVRCAFPTMESRVRISARAPAQEGEARRVGGQGLAVASARAAPALRAWRPSFTCMPNSTWRLLQPRSRPRTRRGTIGHTRRTPA